MSIHKSTVSGTPTAEDAAADAESQGRLASMDPIEQTSETAAGAADRIAAVHEKPMGSEEPAGTSRIELLKSVAAVQAYGAVSDADVDVSPAAILAAARAYVSAGISVMPIASDMSKRPAGRLLPQLLRPDGTMGPSWHPFRVRRPSDAELLAWYEQGGHSQGGVPGIAVVTGAVSGGLVGLDFDAIESFAPWRDLVQARHPLLLDRLIFVDTPRPGRHAYFRCADFGFSERLACALERDSEGKGLFDPSTNKPKRRTLIEKKAEGSYCLVPPSPRFCHPSQGLYRYAPGNKTLAKVATIAPGEMRVLLNAACALNELVEPDRERRPSARRVKGDGGRPGDDFNKRAHWDQILNPHGWRSVGTSGGITYWCRPGKGEGVSATTNYADSDLLYVFSTNAHPLDSDQAYSKFAAFAFLNHNGDFAKAAAAVGGRGFGVLPTASTAGQVDA
jgi:hypothetical protein